MAFPVPGLGDDCRVIVHASGIETTSPDTPKVISNLYLGIDLVSDTCGQHAPKHMISLASRPTTGDRRHGTGYIHPAPRSENLPKGSRFRIRRSKTTHMERPDECPNPPPPPPSDAGIPVLRET